MLGGDYLSDIGSVAGSLTERELSNMFFDKAFIGASGVSGQAGVSTFDIREATKKRIVHDNSKEPYVLVDSTKFGTTTLCKALDLRECILVTDRYHELLDQAKSYIITDVKR